MTPQRRAATILLIAQFLLVLSVAAKYLYERETRPRVWTRANVFDPQTPLRGRYLALSLEVDACGLPRDKEHETFKEIGGKLSSGWNWNVRTLAAREGKLVAEGDVPATSTPGSSSYRVTLPVAAPCSSALLNNNVDLFLAEHAKSPLPLLPHTALWLEVTVPPSGMPRPIQMQTRSGEPFLPVWVGYPGNRL